MKILNVTKEREKILIQALQRAWTAKSLAVKGAKRMAARGPIVKMEEDMKVITEMLNELQGTVS